MDDDEDFRLNPHVTTDLAGRTRTYPSVALARAIRQNRVFQGGRPEGWAGVPGARRYWWLRDMRNHIDAAVANASGLRVMLLQSEIDHVQGTPDYAHCRAQYDGWLAAGCSFVRINPDARYLSVSPDFPANTPVTGDSVSQAVVPENTNQRDLTEASVLEMADRAQIGDGSVNLP